MALAIPVAVGRVLVGRRPEGAHLAGLWEFPGGKVEPGETPAAAARRELAEETGLVSATVEPLVVLVHDYPDRSVRLHAFVARVPHDAVRTFSRGPSAAHDWTWVEPAQLEALAMPAANAVILQALRRHLP